MTKTLLDKVTSRATENQHGLLHAMENKGQNHYHCLEIKEAGVQEVSLGSLSQMTPLPQGSRLRFDTALVPGSGLWFGSVALSSLSKSHTFSREVQILLAQEAAEQTIRCRATNPRILSKNTVIQTASKTSYSNIESCP